MDRDLIGKRPTFHRVKRSDNSFRILLWLSLIVAAIAFVLRIEQGQIQPLFVATPTPTRVAHSYIQEARAYFEAGRIDDPNSEQDAIDTYRLALQEDPQNALVWAELARILTYSSGLMSSDEQSRQRLQEALEAADQAVALAPDDSSTHAIRAFVLDWSSLYASPEESGRLLTAAYTEAVRAIQLNPNDGLSLAFYAEVLLDQQKWSQAEQYADQAVALFENAEELSPYAMDAYRVRATVLESLGAYADAIKDYEAAVKITPNLTFLYIKIGVNYRFLAQKANADPRLYELALTYFERAVNINQQLGVKDPLPYISISKAYSQMGEFYSAALNAEKALSLSPTDPNSYGQLGIIYFKSRNYESAVPALQCAVVGCTVEENLVLQTLSENHPDWNVSPMAVQGMTLESVEVAYYYAMYGQVLAFLSRPRMNYCDQALPVLADVRRVYGEEPVLMEIVTGSERICSELAGSP